MAARLIDELPVIKVSQSTYFVTRRGMEFGAEFHGGALNEFLFEYNIWYIPVQQHTVHCSFTFIYNILTGFTQCSVFYEKYKIRII